MKLFIFEIRTFLLLIAIGYKAELLEVTGLQFSAVLLIRNKIKSFGMLPDREIQTNEAHSKQKCNLRGTQLSHISNIFYFFLILIQSRKT